MNPATESPTEPLPQASIHVHGRHLLDNHNRVIHLRGANVSGCSKVPSSDPEIDIRNPELASYVNRPFSLDEAPVHWARLKRWGLYYLRITVTWEAIEHAGPGEYDEPYLTYLKDLLKGMTEAGLICYVALHQDVWSRLCGGSGAPAWTIQYAGITLDPHTLSETGGAWVEGVDSASRSSGSSSSFSRRPPANRMDSGMGRLEDGGGDVGTDGEVLEQGGEEEGRERGLWPTGYQKLVCASMNTLFWAGKTFAPNLLVRDPTADGQSKNIQTFLQERYLAMFNRLVEALDGVEGVLGYEMMNEPHPGYIGIPSLYNFNYDTDLHLGNYPSALQSFALAAGYPQEVPHYVRSWPFPSKIKGYRTMNPKGLTLWTTDAAEDALNSSGRPNERRCIWAQHGVWGYDADTNRPIVLKEGYFTKHAEGKQVSFYEDFYWPFVKRWEDVVKRRSGGRAMLHVEGVPNEFCPDWPEDVRPREKLIFSPHWYDLNALFNKSFGFMTVNVQGLSRGMFVGKAIYFGHKAARNNYSLQIGNIVKAAREKLGEVPIVIGETGVPMDLNRKEAFRTGDFEYQSRMIDCILTAIERSLIGVNLWNYNPKNTDEAGDEWNHENFSWFSEDKRKDKLYERLLSSDRPENGQDRSVKPEDLDLGARMLDEIVRPYPLRTAGIPLALSYDPDTTVFRFGFANPVDVEDDRPFDSTLGPPLTGHPRLTSRETTIFLPPRFVQAWKRPFSHRPFHVKTSDGSWTVDEQAQSLIWTHAEDAQGAEHWIEMQIKPKGEEGPAWGEIALYCILALVAVVLAFYLNART